MKMQKNVVLISRNALSLAIISSSLHHNGSLQEP